MFLYDILVALEAHGWVDEAMREEVALIAGLSLEPVLQHDEVPETQKRATVLVYEKHVRQSSSRGGILWSAGLSTTLSR